MSCICSPPTIRQYFAGSRSLLDGGEADCPAARFHFQHVTTAHVKPSLASVACLWSAVTSRVHDHASTASQCSARFLFLPGLRAGTVIMGDNPVPPPPRNTLTSLSCPPLFLAHGGVVFCVSAWFGNPSISTPPPNPLLAEILQATFVVCVG